MDQSLHILTIHGMSNIYIPKITRGDGGKIKRSEPRESDEKFFGRISNQVQADILFYWIAITSCCLLKKKLLETCKVSPSFRKLCIYISFWLKGLLFIYWFRLCCTKTVVNKYFATVVMMTFMDSPEQYIQCTLIPWPALPPIGQNLSLQVNRVRALTNILHNRLLSHAGEH